MRMDLIDLKVCFAGRLSDPIFWRQISMQRDVQLSLVAKFRRICGRKHAVNMQQYRLA
jgi:hypothetical protein